MKMEREKTQIERRRYPRLPIKIKFFCHDSTPKEGDGLLHFYSKDLSCGGVFLKGETSISPGNVLHMDFKLPENEQTITVSGVIIRKNDEGVAIRFLTLNIDEFETVENFVTNQL